MDRSLSYATDKIAKSRHLLKRISRQKSRARLVRTNAKLNVVCGKPMPPRSDLHKLYEDSDSDNDISATNSKLLTENSSYPIVPIPKLQEYAEILLNFLSGNEPRSLKRITKSEVPYIVGCKERSKVPENTKKSNYFCNGQYGYDIRSSTNAFYNEENNHTQGNCSSGYNLSESRFNAESNEIAAKLLAEYIPPYNDVVMVENLCEAIDIKQHNPKNCEMSNKNGEKHILLSNDELGEVLQNENTVLNIDYDEDATVEYEINYPEKWHSSQPSTSKGIEYIAKNNQISDQIVLIPTNSFHNEVEIMEKPFEHQEISTYRNNSLFASGKEMSTKIENIINFTEIEKLLSENKTLIDKYSKHKDCSAVDIVEPEELEEESVTNEEGKAFNQNRVNVSDKYQYTDLENHKFNTTIKLQETARIDHEILQSGNVDQPNNLSKNDNYSSKPFLGTCSICFESLSKDNIGSTVCGHVFCIPCIKEALNRKPKSCPRCRKKLRGIGYHRLYF